MLSARVVKDASKLLGAQFVVALVSIALSAWLIRKVPPSDLALWPVAIGLGGVISALGSFGMGDFFVRVIPKLLAQGKKEEAGAVLKTGIGFNLLGCSAAAVGLYLAAEPAAKLFLHDSQQASMVQLLAGVAVFVALRERLGWALQAVEEFGKVAILKVFVDVGRLPIMVALFIAYGLKGLLIGLMIVPMAATLLSLWWLRRHMFVSWRFASPRQVLGIAWPYYGVSLTSLAAGRAQYLLVGMLATPVALASYFVANKFAGYLQYFGKFAIAAVTPKLSQKGAMGAEEAERAIRKCTRYMALGLLPLHAGVAVLAWPLIRLYAGRQYSDAGTVLAVLAIALLFQMVFKLFRVGVQVLGKPWHLLALSIIQGLVNPGAFILLVPAFGALGAAVANLGTFVVMTVFAAGVLSSTLRLQVDARAITVGGGATLAMGLSIGLLQVAMPNWDHKAILAFGVLVGVAVYGLALVRQLQRADIELVYKALPVQVANTRVGQAVYGALLSFFVGSGQAQMRNANAGQ